MAGVGQLDSYWCLWFRLQKTVESPQLQSIMVVDISFVVQRLFPMVLATIETHQLRVDTVVDAPVQVGQIFPVVVQMPIPMVPTARRTMRFPSCWTCGDRCPCGTGRAGHSCRDAEADPHGLVDHGDSPAALR